MSNCHDVSRKCELRHSERYRVLVSLIPLSSVVHVMRIV
jgi:hypothetical protein